MEGETLHPTVDSSGKHLFDLVEVVGVAQERSRRAVDPTTEGERDARAFELLDAGHGIRDLVTRLRISADVAKRLADTWRDAGGRDVLVPAARKAELAQCLGPFRDAAELVQRARAAAAESDRGHEEYTQVQNRLSNLVVVFGEFAASIPALEEQLPAVRAKLDVELVEMLDGVLAVSRRRAEVGPTAPLNEAATPNEFASPEAIRDEARAPSTSDATPTDAPTTANDAIGPANSEAIPRADSRASRERLLDAWLMSLVADDARLLRLAALLKREELEMFAGLERGIGADVAVAAATGNSGSPREQLLDTLLVSITKDDERFEKIGALLTSQELDMLVELGRGLPECNTPTVLDVR